MTTTTQKPKTDEIARQAYMLYEQRGCQPGHEMDDWLKAEALLSSPAPTRLDSNSGNGNKSAQQPAKLPDPFAGKRSKQF